MNKEQKYPCYEQGHIKHLDNIIEIKTIPFQEIEVINEMIKNGWIYITVYSDLSVLLGKPR